MDPIAEDFPHLSPFNYADNSPIANIDLHGLQSVWAGSGTIMANAQGKIDNKTMKQIQTMQGKQAFAGISTVGTAGSLAMMSSTTAIAITAIFGPTEAGFAIVNLLAKTGVIDEEKVKVKSVGEALGYGTDKAFGGDGKYGKFIGGGTENLIKLWYPLKFNEDWLDISCQSVKILESSGDLINNTNEKDETRKTKKQQEINPAAQEYYRHKFMFEIIRLKREAKEQRKHPNNFKPSENEEEHKRMNDHQTLY